MNFSQMSVEELFQALDRDGDGKIGPEDYRYLLRTMSYASLADDCPQDFI